MPADGAIGPRVGIREIAGSGLLRGISRDRVALDSQSTQTAGAPDSDGWTETEEGSADNVQCGC